MTHKLRDDFPPTAAIKDGTREQLRQWSSVEAPARLHLGFVDLSGSLGRRFGSLGLTLEGMTTRVSAAHASRVVVRGVQGERAAACLQFLKQETGLEGGVELVIAQGIPAHAGLGSGTQLALAVGTAVSNLFGLDLTPRAIANLLQRGARSGIGIGAFERGGFLLDGGRGTSLAPPPLISRLEFPAHWRVVLIFDNGQRGLHGDAEREAFRALPPFPEREADRLARLVLMQALPALTEADLAGFGAAVSELQRVVGDHFAPAQGGRFTSPRVARALAALESDGIACIGQSSWGPTGFAVLDSDAGAASVVRRLQGQFAHEPAMEFMAVSGRNRGADAWIQDEPADCGMHPHRER